MPAELPVSGVVPISTMTGEDEDETTKLREMEARARAFLSSFPWCESIKELYFGTGIGDVFAIFFAHIRPSRAKVDEYLWVIVGDIPSAYLVTDDCQTPKEALEGYIGEMRKWVALAAKGQSTKDVIPVNLPSTPEWAETLRSRLDTLELQIIPQWFVE
jgi:hypothetical protein